MILGSFVNLRLISFGSYLLHRNLEGLKLVCFIRYFASSALGWPVLNDVKDLTIDLVCSRGTRRSLRNAVLVYTYSLDELLRYGCEILVEAKSS